MAIPRRAVAGGTVVAILVLGLACGGSGTGPNPPPTAITIDLIPDLFDPADAVIAAGGTVTWQWTADPDGHDVTSYAVGGSATFPSIPAFVGVQMVQTIIPAAGTYYFRCSIHSPTPVGGVCTGMCGKITAE